MSTSNPLPIGPAYGSVQDVIDGLSRLERAFLRSRDRRGVFVTAYLQITRELQRRIAAGRFADNAWVGRYLVAFANLYRAALAAYEAGQRGSVTEAWKVALDTSAAGVALVIQDLMLGINAHINHDLPLALKNVGVDPDRELRYRDHIAVNDALRETTETVQDRIAAMYASGLGVLDRLLGNLDEEFTSFSFDAARGHAWNMGVALVNVQTEPERALLTASISRQAAVVARVILAPNAPFPWLIDVLREIERIEPWWDYLLAAPEPSTSGLAPLAAPRAMAATEALGASQPPATLDEVIERLGDFIARFDRERDRLSIYPTVYQRITRRVKTTVEAGGFRDPDWMTRLDLLFAGRYFRTLELYLAGRFDELPKCWAFAFQAVRAGRTMIVQDIVLQIIPRVVYDLPITLLEAGLDRNLDARLHDYETTYELFIDELDEIQDTLAQKYSPLLTFGDVLAGRLDEMISNVLYTEARREAWADGLALFNHPAQADRARLLRRLDRKAVNSANQALFWQSPAIMWMCQAVRELEDTFAGTWSQQVEARG